MGSNGHEERMEGVGPGGQVENLVRVQDVKPNCYIVAGLFYFI